MLKVGIVGWGRGGGFFRILRHFAHVQVVAACEPRSEPAAAARASGIAAVDDDYERFLSRDLDVVIVATPPALHARQAIQALAAGRHVLSEVPAAHTLDECMELAEAVHRSSRTYMLAENYRFSRTAETVNGMARAGLFGEVYNAVAEYLHESRHLAVGRDGRATWRTTYPLVQYTTHNLGPVLWIMDQHVTRACALDSGPSRYPDMQRSDVAAALFQTSGGGVVQFRIDGHSPRPHNMPYFAIQGTRGAFEAERGLGDAPKVYVQDASPAGQWQPLADYEQQFLGPEWFDIPTWATEGGHGTAEYFMLSALARSLLDGSPSPIDIHAALNWTVPGICAQESIRLGGAPVDVPGFGPCP
jgi:predicted dehydrogenase